MADLNDAVDSTGVSRDVISLMTEWRDWLKMEDEPLTFQLYFRRVNRRAGEYIVQCLRAFLHLELSSGESHPQKKTTLHLYNGVSAEAINFFCEFLRETSCHLVALQLVGDLPAQHFRRLLESLHTNTSVKELNIDSIQDDQRAVWISSLLRHKTDFTILRFSFCSFRIVNLLPGLCQRHAHLQTLAFVSCAIGDEGVRLVLEVIRDGDFPVLNDLDLSYNDITSAGLRCLAKLGPLALRCLEKLNLSLNRHLLDDLESTGAFVRSMLVSKDMTLKELDLGFCGAEHTPIIIKSCENDGNKLQKLDISSNAGNLQPICDQIIESVPKIKKLESLIIRYHRHGEFCNVDSHPLLVKALQKNSSIFKLETNDAELSSLIRPILIRNQLLKYVDSLLALQPKTQKPIGSKSGIWYMAFAKMGRQFDDVDETQGDRSVNYRGYTGASAIFKILQKRPAILEKQLRRPAAAAEGLRGGAASKDNDGVQKDTIGGRKRRRL